MQKKYGGDSRGSRSVSARTKRVVLTGLLFALMLVLSALENAIPLPMPVPGIKLGLANVVVMYSLFFMKKSTAFQLTALKAIFVFFTRGAVASLLSLCGGLLSVLVMLLLLAFLKEKISYLMISVVGAVCHNAGQLLAVSAVYTNIFIWAYFPALLVAGILAGVATSTLLKITLPALKRLDLK